eukprot:CAMPEP_0184499210 /NCGR_PEP_ID=MMETSP0113_2-20130426/40921_1 /TAXON_ID=91329 /ORGANISM="Norrisiella sphaerica, Strain BC52" /LENGTH=256 /DNA_ID=CAMNT_0026887045 /DNA_START=8 /DNA_END=778 /DNA_ORIENTATION=+
MSTIEQRGRNNDSKAEKGALSERIRMVNKIFREQERDLTVRLQALRRRRKAALSALYDELKEIDEDFAGWQKRLLEKQKTGSAKKDISELQPRPLEGLNPAETAKTAPIDAKRGIRGDGHEDEPHSESEGDQNKSRGTRSPEGKMDDLSSMNGPPSLSKYFYKVCAVVGNRFFSVFDGETEFVAGVPLRQDVDSKGYPEFVFSTVEGAKMEKFPKSAAMAHTPRVVLQCVTAGRYKNFGNHYYWFENLVPKRVIEG